MTNRYVIAESVYDNPYTLPMPDPALTFSGPGYYSPQPPRSAAAVASLVCALVGIFTALPAIAAVILGAIGMQTVRQDRLRGEGAAQAGLAIGALVIAGWTAIFVSIMLTT